LILVVWEQFFFLEDELEEGFQLWGNLIVGVGSAIMKCLAEYIRDQFGWKIRPLDKPRLCISEKFFQDYKYLVIGV
jgi:hypothetical protein